MKAIKINNKIEVFEEIPKKWNGNKHAYHLLKTTHYKDGWRDYTLPVLTEFQELGERHLDKVNDVYTSKIVNMTPE